MLRGGFTRVEEQLAAAGIIELDGELRALEEGLLQNGERARLVQGGGDCGLLPHLPTPQMDSHAQE